MLVKDLKKNDRMRKAAVGDEQVSDTKRASSPVASVGRGQWSGESGRAGERTFDTHEYMKRSGEGCMYLFMGQEVYRELVPDRVT